MSIYKAYDIRGIYPSELNEDIAYRIGRAFVHYTKANNVVVGHDIRLSSNALKQALIKGLIDQGANVTDIGLCTTPMLNFSIIHLKQKAGIMVTASHNPKEYNGFKLMRENALMVVEEELKNIEKLVLNLNFEKPRLSGSLRKKDVTEDYINHLLKFTKISAKNPLKVIIDFSNGTASIPASPLFRKIDFNYFMLNAKPDGNFPDHEPNPLKEENLEHLKIAVRENNAHIGIAFDGDCDRVVFVDDQGKMIPPDILANLLFKIELEKSPGQKIYYDLRYSKITPETIKENKGIPVKMRVGNPFYKEKLFKEGGLLAAEFSGHIMYKENYGIDDGLFAAIKLLNYLSSQTEKISQLIKPFKKYYQTPELNFTVKDKDKKIKEIEHIYGDINNGLISRLDGITIEFKSWWFNLRKSNTEPLLRLRVEANTAELLKEKAQELKELISGVMH